MSASIPTNEINARSGYDRDRAVPPFLTPFVLPDADWWPRPKTALAAVSRGLGVDVGAVTTPRASARTTRQTSNVHGTFGWMEGAHPSILLNLLRCNYIALEETVDHSSEVPCSHLAVRVVHSLFLAADCMDCRVTGWLFGHRVLVHSH